MESTGITIHTNNDFLLAVTLVEETRLPVFLTGKAGTGKTTFLRYIRNRSLKNMVVVAPTGVAAIQAGGVTIHSFFQMPMAAFIPEMHGGTNQQAALDRKGLRDRIRLSSERKELMRQLDLLVIDEISMVRADLLDAMDEVLRWVRSSNKPFGGVHVLFIGDLFQLPPVVKEDDWNLLSRWYKTPFFFSSRVLQQFPPVQVELQTVYRQRDKHFIQLLHAMRNNQMSPADQKLLLSRFLPGTHEDAILLTTHNQKADQLNQRELNALQGKEWIYDARIQGEFSEKNYPADTRLVLKEGARVMFIKNDPEKEKRFFNGKTGIIEKLETDRVWVRCRSDQELIETQPEFWRNIRFRLNSSSNQIEEEELGSFSQLPIRLAWAITIHKSQGLTFEEVTIDAADAFAPGQIYVALSRCTRLEGIRLTSWVNTQKLAPDPRIVQFLETASTQPTEQLIHKGQIDFQQELIQTLFETGPLVTQTETAIRIIGKEADRFSRESLPWLLDLQTSIELLDATSRRFIPQLQGYFQQGGFPGNHPELSERLHKGAGYYSENLNDIFRRLRNCPVQTDNRALATEAAQPISGLFEQVQWLLHAWSFFPSEFTTKGYLQHLRKWERSRKKIDLYSGTTEQLSQESAHPELFQQIKNWRDEKAKAAGLPVYRIISTAAISEISLGLPLNREELLLINGMGKTKLQQHGEAILQLVQQYCAQHELTGNMDYLRLQKSKSAEDQPDKKPVTRKTGSKTNTRQISLELFNSGKSIEAIAQERDLSTSTIESHLAHFIGSGQLAAEKVVAIEKIRLVELAVASLEKPLLKAIHQFCQDRVSYGEIRMTLASISTNESGNPV